MKQRLPLTIVVCLVVILLSSSALYLYSWPGPKLSITRGLKPVSEGVMEGAVDLVGESVWVRGPVKVYRVDMSESEVLDVVDKELSHMSKGPWAGGGGWLYVRRGKQEQVLVKAREDGLPGTEIAVGHGVPVKFWDRVRLKAMLIGT
jgi:hypothetical protein